MGKDNIDAVPLLGGYSTAEVSRPRTQSRLSLVSKRKKMSRRANVFGICGVCCLCILLFIATTQHNPLLTTSLVTSTKTKLNNVNLGAATELFDERRLSGTSSFQTAFQTQQIISYNLTATIKDVLAEQQSRIATEMENFEYPNHVSNANARLQLTDLTPKTNGTPIRSVIITTWRSGSTFLGDILNAVPGNYYHYEPLLDFGIVRIRNPPEAKPAIRNLINLLNCNYTHLHDYLDYGKEHTYLFEHNERLWSVCKEFPHYCWQPKFLTPFCKLFPIQSMKTVRLSLAMAEKLLQEKSLNVRILLLVRDPRGTMQSRKHRTWCAGNPDCEDPNLLCSDLVDDYKAAEILLNKYAERFRTLRYEDLSLSPYEMSQEILQFYGLPFDPMVEEFLNTHTKENIGGVSSTYRDSKSAPFHWKQDLRIDEIKYIQEQCKEAMQLWGYRLIDDFMNFQNTFDPIIMPPPFA